MTDRHSAPWHERVPDGDLDLTAAMAYISILNAASQQSGNGQVLVNPGNPNQSCLWHKIMNTHRCPEPDGETDGETGGMPAALPRSIDSPEDVDLSPEDVDLITEWICCGAFSGTRTAGT